MKESAIRKLVIDELEKQNWLCWYPYKVRYKKETDIFGVIDVIAIRRNKIRLIQLTTYSNISARKKKILKVWRKHKITRMVEIWGLKKDKTFKIVYV